MASLDLDLTEPQQMLRDAVQRLLADVEAPGWQALTAQLGLGGLTLPEAAGGFGGGVADVALVMAELGPALAGADWLSHAAACAGLAGIAPEFPLLEALASGTARAALVCAATAQGAPDLVDGVRLEGSARLVAGGAGADLYVIAIGGNLAVIRADAPGLTREDRALHDGTLAADLHFAGAAAELVARAEAGALLDLVRAGRCAEAVGLMQRMLTDTADYLNQRRQFGAPIASFQALRHRLADMQLAALQAAALTEQAVTALAACDADAAVSLAAACVAVRDAARTVGEGAVQLHGAMGLTEELRLGARFKRVLAIAAGLGSEAQVLERFAAAA